MFTVIFTLLYNVNKFDISLLDDKDYAHRLRMKLNLTYQQQNIQTVAVGNERLIPIPKPDYSLIQPAYPDLSSSVKESLTGNAVTGWCFTLIYWKNWFRGRRFV